MSSLGTTTFSGAQRSIPPPNLMDVMFLALAVSNAREEYSIWLAGGLLVARPLHPDVPPTRMEEGTGLAVAQRCYYRIQHWDGGDCGGLGPGLG
ncbi:hypothetical protein BS47DRAFT_1337887 [Hydnum rufescens UP504]|uniref:Uncharacterized protein n=1 Tax=Hydnum rufescens UP504 TaxID=1448309 RepID=A0A9P6B882_9AGAM|nr:hypothetical protein BS47DRAFT_1337887 [Hydnum rufescens UP504]